VAYHEAFWVVIGTAAPVIALAAVVALGQLWGMDKINWWAGSIGITLLGVGLFLESLTLGAAPEVASSKWHTIVTLWP